MPPRISTGANRPQVASRRLSPEGRARQAGFQRAHLVLARQPHGGQDQRQAGQHAGHHAGGKQRRHRRAGHQHRIDDEGHRRRDQDVGGRRRADHAGRIGRRVAGARHRGDHHRAHRGRVGRARAGDAAQEHGHHDGHQRQHAGAAADDGDGKVHQPQRDARAVEDRAHQHEHRYRQQRVLAQAGIEVLRHGEQPEPLRIGIGQRDGRRTGQAQRRADGHAQQHQRHEGDEQQRRDHDRRPRRTYRPSARPAMATDITGSQIVYHHIGTPMPGEVSS